MIIHRNNIKPKESKEETLINIQKNIKNKSNRIKWMEWKQRNNIKLHKTKLTNIQKHTAKNTKKIVFGNSRNKIYFEKNKKIIITNLLQ